MIELPEALNKIWYTRQYYGTVAHNAKAVYQKFMGWYDSNPVNLNPLMPSDSAKKWVEYLAMETPIRFHQIYRRHGQGPLACCLHGQAGAG